MSLEKHLSTRLIHPLRQALVVSLIAAATAFALTIPARGGTPATAAKAQYPRTPTLTDATVAHWAMVVKRVTVRTRPNSRAAVVTTLARTTSDGALTVVLVLGAVDRNPTETWYRVRLPILPNNSTGWVPRKALGKLTAVRTHLYVDRARLTATLERDGRTIFRTRIGIGREYSPTPPGEFYVRVKYLGFHNPVYGPVAFATSARSAVLTDWPGGGFVGIHGTNEPQILPGRVSHGCIRMRNEAIVKLAHLMSVGTPLTIR